MNDSSNPDNLFPSALPLHLPALERMAIEEALRRVGGNRTHAARLLGIGLRTLRNKLRDWRQPEVLTNPEETTLREYSAAEVPAAAAEELLDGAQPSQAGRSGHEDLR